MNNDLALVATFIYPHEAIFIKGTLAIFGIKSYLKSDRRPFKNPFYAMPVHRKRLFIDKKDIPEAFAVFAQIKPHGHFTILLNNSHLRFTSKNHFATNPDKRLVKICACVYTVIITGVLFSLFHGLIGL